MMEAYVDDSGTGDPPVFLLAGFVGRAERWAEFSERWIETLWEPPRLKYFKMKEAAALEGQFKGWSELDRDKRLATLVNIIKDYVLVGVSSIVFHRDYAEIIRDKLTKETDSPYWLMYHSIMDTVCRWQIANGLRERINFIFDEQFKQSDIVQATWGVFYEQMPDEYKKFLGGHPIHKSDTDACPLQAADMLAWHIRRDYYELDRGITFTSPTMEALRLIPGAHDRWTRERLQGILLGIRRLNTQSGRATPHEYRDMIKRLPDDISKTNLEIVGNTPSNASALVVPYPAIGTKRFLLVDSCPVSRSPHLHRRAGNKCVLREPASVRPSGSAPPQ